MKYPAQYSLQHAARLNLKRISASGRKAVGFEKMPGYTLLELMVVLGIASIIMAAAAPSVTGMLNNNAQINAVNLLNSAIGSARASAVTRKRQVFLESMSGSDDWSEGVNIKLGLMTNEPELVTTFEADNKIVIKSTTGAKLLSFDQLGRVSPPSSTFEICNQNVGQAVVIDVNFFGNPVIRKSGNDILYSSCIKV